MGIQGLLPMVKECQREVHVKDYKVIRLVSRSDVNLRLCLDEVVETIQNSPVDSSFPDNTELTLTTASTGSRARP